MQILREISKNRVELSEQLLDYKEIQLLLKELLESEDEIRIFEAINALDDFCLNAKSKFQRNKKNIKRLQNAGFHILVKNSLEISREKLKNTTLDIEKKETLTNLEKYLEFLNSYLKLEPQN